METKAFRIGDRVICVDSQDGNELVVGHVGTVKIHESDSDNIYGIEFDDFIGRGWWVAEDNLELCTETDTAIPEISIPYDEVMG